ncbi:DUF2199 domain-containing protein [Chryseobacterium fistulae]|uniref:DUF2199 domain-containing protein n=1 Tax=Chryseobacterium fistulae TaxID=2675058 RepID=A0A6N4XK77_9FLAO|nr:DUF2199 domain-containing protein [Chryseobacterium fistulae]CAA7386254.1 hypothetical protein CHRY9393_00546 [Chryseobacterium fistulae]
MKYICKCCGKEQEDWPALAYSSPSLYMDLSEEELKNAELTSDLCTITHSSETYYFIRAVMVQEVNDNCQNLEYGVWVSLSEKSFNEYVDNYNNQTFETTYFGWLENYFPDYEFENSIPTNVVVDNTIGRPFIYPHQSCNHLFVEDFYNGIPKEEAERRINRILKPQQ